jgi:cation diffusion facilitator CzcD-associated flavoprotein CzcO
MGSPGDQRVNGVEHGYDVLCIGAGLSGIYTTYRLRELGLRGKILEAGSVEGGTWVRIPRMYMGSMLN